MAAGHLPDFIKYNLQHGKNGLYAPVFPGKIFWSSQSPEDPEAQFLYYRRVITKVSGACGIGKSWGNCQFIEAGPREVDPRPPGPLMTWSCSSFTRRTGLGRAPRGWDRGYSRPGEDHIPGWGQSNRGAASLRESPPETCTINPLALFRG